MPRRKEKCRSSFTLERRPGQPTADWVNVFEKAVLDMKAEGLNVELKSTGWHLFERSNSNSRATGTCVGAVEGENELAAIRGALVKLFLDAVIGRGRAQFQTDSRTDFANLVTGSQGVTRPTKLVHVTYRKIQTPRRKSRVKKKQAQRRPSNVKWMTWPRWWKNWKTNLADRTWKICESFQRQCTKDSPHLREKTRNCGYQPSSSASSHAAFGSRQSSLSSSGRGKVKTRPKGGSVQQKKLVTRCFDCNRFGH